MKLKLFAAALAVLMFGVSIAEARVVRVVKVIRRPAAVIRIVR
jgi:hypothetical protein